MSEKLFVFDTTLRDGEQVPGCQLNTVEKIEVARALESLGVVIIEAGFPISSPGDFKSVEEISKSVNDPVICALTRAVEKDIDVAADSLKYARRKRIHTGIGTSYYHINYKLNSNEEEIIKRAVKLQGHSTTNAPTISQYAGIEALEGPQDEIRKMHGEFEKRRNFVYKKLTDMTGISCSKPQGAFYAFPNISAFINKSYNGNQIRNSADLAYFLLKEARVVLIP